jgi:hypothetical protein
MKTKLKLAATLLALSTLNPQLSTVLAQGSLTPPGAPAPTMKALDEIEPRTAVNAVNTPGDATSAFTISQPGSYYLTGNITVTTNHGIIIATNGVTLDLKGFTILSTASPASGSGILLAGASDVSILNGHIQGGVTNNGGVYNGPGFQNGVYYSGAPAVNVRVSGLSVSGVSLYGIYLGGECSSEVDCCTLRNIANAGIAAGSVNQCTVYDSGGTGIIAETVANSYAVCTSPVSGSYGIFAASAQNCYATCAGYIGIDAYTMSNCRGDTVSGYGIFGQIAIGCYGRCTGGISSIGNGMSVIIANNCYGYAEGSGYGLGAYIGIGSYGYSNSGTQEGVTYKYNMP